MQTCDSPDSLQEAGDVVPAAGRPDEGVGLHGDVVGHQLGRLLAERPAGVPHAVMVHSKPETHDDTMRPDQHSSRTRLRDQTGAAGRLPACVCPQACVDAETRRHSRPIRV